MKGVRLAVIKFIATIVIAICALCTEMEAPMAQITDSTATVITTKVSDTTAGRPSS